MELWQEIIEKQKMLDKAIKELAQNGYKLAECERDYKIAVNKKALELRSQDVPVTLINQVIYVINMKSHMLIIVKNVKRIYVPNVKKNI